MRKLHVFLPCVFPRRKCTPALVKHTRVGSNWVNGVSHVMRKPAFPICKKPKAQIAIPVSLKLVDAGNALSKLRIMSIHGQGHILTLVHYEN